MCIFQRTLIQTSKYLYFGDADVRFMLSLGQLRQLPTEPCEAGRVHHPNAFHLSTFGLGHLGNQGRQSRLKACEQPVSQWDETGSVDKNHSTQHGGMWWGRGGSPGSGCDEEGSRSLSSPGPVWDTSQGEQASAQLCQMRTNPTYLYFKTPFPGADWGRVDFGEITTCC